MRKFKQGRFTIDETFLPADDVVFSYMFEDERLFCSLMKAVTGREIELIEKPLSQVSYKDADGEGKKRLKSIRVDVQAKAKDSDNSLDMQTSGSSVRIKARSAFYACRMFTSQDVVDGEYEKLKPANVMFVMNEANEKSLKTHNEAVSPKGVNIYKFCNVSNSEPDTIDQLNMYVVYVPTYVKYCQNANDPLYIFSNFFSTKTQEQADDFLAKFGREELAKEIITMYGTAVIEKRRWLGLRKKQGYFGEKEFEVVKVRIEKEKALLEAKAAKLAAEKALLESKAEQAESKAEQAESKAEQADSKATKLANEKALLESKAEQAKIEALMTRYYLLKTPIETLAREYNFNLASIKNYVKKNGEAYQRRLGLLSPLDDGAYERNVPEQDDELEM